MTYDQFIVTGKAIRPSAPQHSIQLPTRKHYNASYFHDNRYRHEVANHYRDFKMRPRLRRRKRNVLSYNFSKTASSAIREAPSEYLTQLPMAVRSLPRFENECNTTTRGQRRLCDDKRENLVCNDTLKRIQNAAATRKDNKSIEALRNLVRRQLKQFPRFEPRSNTKAPSEINVVYSSLEKCKYANDLQKPSDINEDYQQRRRQPQRRRSLGKLESVDGLLTNKYYPHHQQQQQQQQFVANYKEIPFTSDCCVTRTTVRKQRNS
ncbi:uncharacterized protein LOC101897729 [Musca domestica]|uniref:Uncharacterized protein LOC101897729 n=1 Tax=Musca domestica TaxID=7370 RepID=A0ABM3UXL7_MUSDO|nr:uncharacterized protein LOC101897729 [Musca domestica]